MPEIQSERSVASAFGAALNSVAVTHVIYSGVRCLLSVVIFDENRTISTYTSATKFHWIICQKAFEYRKNSAH